MLLHSVPVLELRSMPEGLVHGIASTFGGVDTYGDTIAPGAFAETLQEHAKAGTTPAMLFAHRQDTPIGRWESLVEDRRGLRVEGRLNLKTAVGRDAFEHLRAGDVSGLSIGYVVPPGGAELRADGRTLLAVKLREVSIVTLAADDGARVTGVKAAGGERPVSLREFQAALQELGFSRREAARIAEKGFGAAEPNESTLNEAGLLAVKAALRSLNESLKG